MGSGLLYDKVTEKKILGECMDKWQQSSRCDTSSSGDRCGIVLLNYKNTGHCRNVLFERCRVHGGDGHENLILEFLKESGSKTLNCALIYGYSIQNNDLRMNSGTFNGNDMPEEMKIAFPEIFTKTRNGEKIDCDLGIRMFCARSGRTRKALPKHWKLIVMAPHAPLTGL